MDSIKYNGKEFYWKRIQFISFVLAVFIIIRHNSSIYNYDAPTILSFYENFKYTITEIAVPLFFIISGLNFFRDFSIPNYKKKFKSRIKSLLIPYFVWNVLFCIFCIITSTDFFSQFFIGRTKFEITPLNVFLGCFFHMECNSQFWFVFTLMACILLNPLLYYILKNKISGAIFLLILYFAIMFLGLELPSYFFYRTDAFLYYYLGAFLGFHCKNYFFQENDIQKKEKSAIVRIASTDYMSILIGILCMFSTLLLLIPSLHSGIRAVVIILASYGFWRFSVICRFMKMKWLPQGGTTFLMYAAHGIIQPVTVKLLYFALPKFAWVSIINFVLAITFTVLICMIIRWFTKKYIPFVDNLITGWRR